ncbi:MAG: transketolase [Candidatus Aenigmarchaeota archaeon]|nr:transketolase [Candidatus Aenigmarchaeota archaeon]
MNYSVPDMKKLATEIRKDIIRMTCEAGSGHPGGSLSSVEIMVSLYFNVMKHDPKNQAWDDRDRFVLSKGHVCPVLYASLARRGYFPPEELMTLRKFGSRLQGHPHRLKLSCLETSSGSLGQGLSIASGMAIGLRMDKKSPRVYCLMGDGELQEGQVWEAAMTGAHYKLDNLCGIVDVNGLQIDGRTSDVKNLEPLADKWKAFGWHTIEVDGHNVEALISAFREAERTKGKPTVILAKTVKGKGVSFMENKAEWHGKPPSKEEAAKALKELGETC